MNYTALQSELQSLVQFGGYTNISPTPDYGDYINRGLRQFSWDTEYNVAEDSISTVADQATYTLASPDWRAIKEVYYDSSSVLREASELLIYRENPLWRFTSSAVPTRFWQESPTVLRLYPAPSQSSKTILIRGTRCATPLSSGSDTPTGCPEVFHPAIALQGALQIMKRYATESESARMQAYENEYKKLVAQLRSEMMKQNAPLSRAVNIPNGRRVQV